MNEIIMALAIENKTLANENAELLKYVEALTEALNRTSQRLAEAEDNTDERDKAIFKLAAATLKEKYDAEVKELVEEVKRLKEVNSLMDGQRKKDIVAITELKETIKNYRQYYDAALTKKHNDYLKQMKADSERIADLDGKRQELLIQNATLERKNSELQQQLQEAQKQNSLAPKAKKEETHYGYIDSLGHMWSSQIAIERSYGLARGSVSSYLAGRQDKLTVRDEWWWKKDEMKLQETKGRIDIARFDLDKFRSLPENTRQNNIDIWAAQLFNHSRLAAEYGKETANSIAPLSTI